MSDDRQFLCTYEVIIGAQMSLSNIAKRVEKTGVRWRNDFDEFVMANEHEKRIIVDAIMVHSRMIGSSPDLEGEHERFYRIFWDHVHESANRDHPLVRSGWYADELGSEKMFIESSERAGVMVELPYLTPKLSALIDVMKKFWSNYDSDKPHKSSAVAKAIDEAMGWRSQKDGKASRNGQAFAAVITPDEVRKNNPRYSKGRG